MVYIHLRFIYIIIFFLCCCPFWFNSLNFALRFWHFNEFHAHFSFGSPPVWFRFVYLGLAYLYQLLCASSYYDDRWSAGVVSFLLPTVADVPQHSVCVCSAASSQLGDCGPIFVFVHRCATGRQGLNEVKGPSVARENRLKNG